MTRAGKYGAHSRPLTPLEWTLASPWRATQFRSSGDARVRTRMQRAHRRRHVGEPRTVPRLDEDHARDYATESQPHWRERTIPLPPKSRDRASRVTRRLRSRPRLVAPRASLSIRMYNSRRETMLYINNARKREVRSDLCPGKSIHRRQFWCSKRLSLSAASRSPRHVAAEKKARSRFRERNATSRRRTRSRFVRGSSTSFESRRAFSSINRICCVADILSI